MAWCARPVGDRYVVEYMRKHGYNVGGEQSGHMVLSDFATTGDGLVSALQVMSCVVAQDKPVSEVCARFEALPQLLRNVRYSERQAVRRSPCAQSHRRGLRKKLGDRGRFGYSPIRHGTSDSRDGGRR